MSRISSIISQWSFAACAALASAPTFAAGSHDGGHGAHAPQAPAAAAAADAHGHGHGAAVTRQRRSASRAIRPR